MTQRIHYKALYLQHKAEVERLNDYIKTKIMTFVTAICISLLCIAGAFVLWVELVKAKEAGRQAAESHNMIWQMDETCYTQFQSSDKLHLMIQKGN